jgi:hypothetical protein
MAVPAIRAAAVTGTALAAVGILIAGCTGAPGHPAAHSSARLDTPAPDSSSHVRQYLPHTPPAPVPSHHSKATPATRPTASPTVAPVEAGPGPCPVTALRITIGAANGAAGSIYYPLEFTNVGGVTCTMYGYPGVSFATGPGGAAIGGPAVRNPTFGRALVTLAPGLTGHASLQVEVAQSYTARRCKPVTAHWLQVFPPASYVASYVSFTAVTCTGSIPGGSTLGIFVVRPGATGP